MENMLSSLLSYRLFLIKLRKLMQKLELHQ
uniref:Uncharacterized protein n=1 Tax=CrAss-like virus sp. ctYsL76 TaxID=2826826 RepID=A0A8S5QMW6_9CAUD|nr:MAG TPA: hypothetical protein [CrAss-like virus sp. ctYsL76]